MRVEAALDEFRGVQLHAQTAVRLASVCRDGLRVVIEIAAPVRPADIMQDNDWKGVMCTPGALLEFRELVEDRVPVVVPVNEDEVRCVDERQRLETLGEMEHEPVAMDLA